MTTLAVSPGQFARQTRFVTITVDQYHRMIEAAILPEGAPIELLDGFLVLKDRSKAGEDPMSIGTAHAFAVDNLGDVLAGVRALGCRLRTQQPITLPPDGEPEPDGAIVRDVEDRYRGRHPGPADVYCVIEVSDSSLDHDRTTKAQLYARAGIPQYVLINLVDRVVEVRAGPRADGGGRYDTATPLGPGMAVEFWCGGGRTVAVPVEQLLP